MSVVATVWAPDGAQIKHKRGKPLTFVRPDARRAMLSAVKVWWPTDPIGKKGTGRTWGQPPVGAEIRLDGEPWMRFEPVPVRDEAGEIVDVVPVWVDIAQKARDEAKAARIAAYKAAQAAKREAEAAALASVTAPVSAGSAAIASGEAIVPAPTSRRRG